MTDPRLTAQRLLGAIDWQSEVHGYCACPGASLHTTRAGKRDCQVHVDGAPTIYCLHASCAGIVAQTNKQLRRELGHAEWELRLPDGRTIRSGDVLRHDGQILPREVVAAKAPDKRAKEQLVMLAEVAKRMAPQIAAKFNWPFEAILADSPLQVAQRDPEDQFRVWLSIWPPTVTVWIGDVFSSGKPEHAAHFRPVPEWREIGPTANYTCGSSFKPGSYRRSNDNINGHRFLVVESDILNRDQVGAVFRFLHQRLQVTCRAIVDTAGKSLHGWFDAPASKANEAKLKALLTALGCDPKLFTFSQPVRLPGAYRDGKLQRLIWKRP